MLLVNSTNISLSAIFQSKLKKILLLRHPPQDEIFEVLMLLYLEG
jgi:hypothetical protein